MQPGSKPAQTGCDIGQLPYLSWIQRVRGRQSYVQVSRIVEDSHRKSRVYVLVGLQRGERTIPMVSAGALSLG